MKRGNNVLVRSWSVPFLPFLRILTQILISRFAAPYTLVAIHTLLTTAVRPTPPPYMRYRINVSEAV